MVYKFFSCSTNILRGLSAYKTIETCGLLLKYFPWYCIQPSHRALRVCPMAWYKARVRTEKIRKTSVLDIQQRYVAYLVFLLFLDGDISVQDDTI